MECPKGSALLLALLGLDSCAVLFVTLHRSNGSHACPVLLRAKSCLHVCGKDVSGRHCFDNLAGRV